MGDSEKKTKKTTGQEWPKTRKEEFSIIRDSSDSEELGGRIDFRKGLLGIRRHVWMILACGVLFAGLSVVGEHFLSHSYTAEAYLLYKNEKAKALTSSYTLNRFSLPTLIQMMRMESHFKATKSILGLNTDIEELMDMVQVTAPRGRSDLIRISCHTEEPSLAINLANTLGNVVVKHSEDLNRRQLQRAQGYFTERLEVAQQRLTRNSREIADFKRENPHFELNTGSSTLVAQASQAKSEYEHAAIMYNTQLVEYENLKRETARIPEHIVQYAYEESPLKDRIVSTEMALLEARTRYAPDNPKIKILESTLEELRKLVSEGSLSDAAGKIYEKNPLKKELDIELMRFHGKLRAAQKLREDMAESLARSEVEMQTLPQEQMIFAKLLQTKESTENELEQLEATLRSVDLLTSLGTSDVELYQMSDNAKSILSRWDGYQAFFPFVGFALGLLFGMGVSFVVEITDRRLCTPRQVATAYNIPCLQVVPEISRLTKRRDADKRLLFYVRSFLDHVEAATGNQPCSSIAFTSALDREGKSCLSYYVARYFKEKLNKRTVIVECDYRKNAFFDGESRSDLSMDSYLKGEAILQDIVFNDDEVDRIKADFDPDMKELTKSQAMKDLWQELSERYDMIIVETPSVVEDDYTLNIARLADVCVFVVGSSQVKKPYVDASLTELEVNGVQPCGIVLNRVYPTYIDDVRVKAERKKNRRAFFRKMFSKKVA